MKILILGLGKSGTTAMVYKVAGGLPNCKAFSGGKPGKYIGDYPNAVYKHTYEARKGKDFDLYRAHLRKEHYDRKIWMARDPRDAAVSRMLYRWHKGTTGCKKQFEAHLELVLRKEKAPACIPFYEICRYTGHEAWPISKEAVFEEERQRYQEMTEFVGDLGDDWLLFTYEAMVARKFDALNRYLGFEVAAGAEVPSGTGKDKVVRKKAAGDWRHWFTDADAELFKPAYTPYMRLVGYDCDDWTPAANPVIEPEFSSVYMRNLPKKATRNLIFRYLDPLMQRLGKSG
ncbi:MAG: hypothetical protein PVI27_07025 [Desulfobacteraceae bacterium]|jgi:hypothetical protein